MKNYILFSLWPTSILSFFFRLPTEDKYIKSSHYWINLWNFPRITTWTGDWKDAFIISLAVYNVSCFLKSMCNSVILFLLWCRLNYLNTQINVLYHLNFKHYIGEVCGYFIPTTYAFIITEFRLKWRHWTRLFTFATAEI